MLEKKILVFSHISHNFYSFIFSILSLIPCNSFFNLDYDYSENSKNYYKCYKKYGFTLKVLNKKL